MVEKSEERKLREQQLESYGRLMAGLSHDLKNHLGIIRESGGLIDDMMEIHGKSLPPALAERLQKMTATIEKRVKVAADMLHHLSSFAHRADSPESSVLLGDILREEAVFLQRFAKMKQVELHIEAEEEIALVTSPTLLHHLIYRVFLFALEQLQAGERLTIAVKAAEKNSETGENGAKNRGRICFYGRETALNGEVIVKEYGYALAAVKGRVLVENGRIILEFQAYY